MKTVLLIAVLLASAPFSKAIPFAVYEFVSLSGDMASGYIGVSKEAFQNRTGPTIDSTQDIFSFSFSLGDQSFSYSDYMGFGYTLSTNRKTLFSEGNLISFFPMRGIANFSTDDDGLVSWNGSFDFEGGPAAVSGTGRWNLVRGASSREPISVSQIAQVPDSGSTFLLLGLSACALPIAGVLGRKLKSRNAETLK